MDCTVTMPRTAFDGICAFLQRFGKIYALPGAVLSGLCYPSSRAPKSVIDRSTGPAVVAGWCKTALRGFARAKIEKVFVLLDLRDLEDDEAEAVIFVSYLVFLRPAQMRVMERVAAEVKKYRELPEMLRIALAAE